LIVLASLIGACSSGETGRFISAERADTNQCREPMKVPAEAKKRVRVRGAPIYLGRVQFAFAYKPEGRRNPNKPSRGNRVQVDGGRYRDGRRAVKGGLFIRGGQCDVVLRIPERYKPSTEIVSWGHNDGRFTARKVRIRQLHPTRGWVGYAGGLVFRGRVCLQLQVQVGDRSTSVPFGLRRRCPS
jgi:hypothetical protein